MITLGRCALCPGVNNCVPPDGPMDADILFIGEAPGHNENRRKQVFIGKTGDEVNRHYLPLAGLRRDSVLFTNAIRCLPVSAGGKLDPNRPRDIALLESCSQTHLFPTIEGTHRKLLVPLGAFACRAVFGDRFDLELEHGIPTESPWGIPTFPMYHPALGIHEPKKMLYIRTDWWRLKRYLNGTLDIPVDDIEPDYREVTDETEIQDLDPDGAVACDTESRRGGSPHCLTYSLRAGHGRLIRAERLDILEAFQQRLAQGTGPVLFHNWLYDWPVVEKMALQFQHARIIDTMSRVFQLGNLPQGLKALAYRELGMLMEDFDDVVTPYSRANVLTYYEIAATVKWPKPDEELIIDEHTGLWKLYKPQGMNTKLKRFFTDYGKAPDTKDVFSMWEKNWENQQQMIEAQIGPWPGKCISHVPFEKVLYYACRDADALYRLWPLLKRMARAVRRHSQEHWREYGLNESPG